MLQVLIIAHITAGLAAVVLGAAAMAAPKRPGPHPRRGRGYLLALAVLSATATARTRTNDATPGRGHSKEGTQTRLLT